MKVVFCACLLVAAARSAPTVVESVKPAQTDYNQRLDYNQPLDYNQQLPYNQHLDYGQQLSYNQPHDYNQQISYNQPLDYNQQINYNQPLYYNHNLDVNQHLDNQRLDYLRGRRSNQFAVVSPCAAASGYSPYYSNHYVSPYSQMYPYRPGRVYRADEDQETMSFSDADQTENMARTYAYDAPSNLAYGVFPNANTGGCGMPLLVSCSPNVVQGRLVKAEPHSYGVSGGYRTEHPGTHDHPSETHDTKTRQLSEK